jgi:hypothetical protein
MKPVNCLLLFSAALLFTRCTNDDAVPVAEPLEIRVSAGFVAGGVESRSTNGDYSYETLADKPLPVSVARLDQILTTGAYLPYTTEALRAAQLKGEDGEIWMTFNPKEDYLARTSGGEHDNTKLIGWYPPVGDTTGSAWSVDDEGKATVRFTVDGQTDILMSALVEGSRKNTFGASPDNGMLFKHLLTKFAVRVFTRDEDVANEWGKVKSIKIKGKAQQCAVVLPGADSPNNTLPTDITFTGNGDLVVYAPDEYIAVPNIGDAPRDDAPLVGTVMAAPEENKITLVVECENKTGTVDISKKFLAGSSYVLSLEFTDHIGLVGCELGEWDSDPINYLLEAGKTEFNLSFGETSGHRLTIKTNAPGLSLDPDALPDWILNPSLSADATADADGFTRYTLTFGAVMNVGEARTGTIRLLAGELTLDVTVNQEIFPEPDGLTNCYIATPDATTVSIPITRAITIGGMDPLADATVEILWDDAGVITGNPVLSGSGDERTIEVQLSDNEGNAVVAVTVGTGDDRIKWSWHIWATDYEPDETNTWTNPNNTAYTFMDRNLGATEAALSLAGRGLLYQWGRKDPFPGVKAGVAGHAALDRFKGMPDAGITDEDKEIKQVANSSEDAVGIAAGIIESVRKPMTFFDSANTTYYNWLPIGKDELWNATGNKKTVFDPCPAGWRVPVRADGTISEDNDDYSPWTGCSTPMFEDGANLGTNALYPAAGFRMDGDIFDPPGNAYCWVASVQSDACYYMWFAGYGWGLIHGHITRRSVALPVRCVKENP